jgi:hypothetical protein
MIWQVSELPDGTEHRALLAKGRGAGAIRDAINKVVGHYTDHAHPLGGYVGIAPTSEGWAVQMHAPDGRIESWRMVMEE